MYDVGDIIEYQTFGGGTRRVRVTLKDSDIKNGRPGFDGEIVGREGEVDGCVWGYDDQITCVVEKAQA